MHPIFLRLPEAQLEEALGSALRFCHRPETKRFAAWEDLARAHPSIHRPPEELQALLQGLADLQMVDDFRPTADGFSIARVTDLGERRLQKKFTASTRKLMLYHIATMAALALLFHLFGWI